MTTSRKTTIFKIRDDASKDFLREAAGWNLDLSACPSIAEITDGNFHDERFAPLATDGAVGAGALKQWLRDAQRPAHRDNAEVSALLDQAVRNGQLPARGDDPETDAKVYIVNGDRVRVERGKDGLWQTGYRGKLYLSDTRDGVAVAVSRDCILREPSGSDRLRIARGVAAVYDATSSEQAQAVFLAGVVEYCKAVGAPDNEHELAQLKYLPLVNKAVHYCWRQIRPGFSGGSDWETFLPQYAGERPYSIALLDSARSAYESALQAEQRLGAMPQPRAAAPVEAEAPSADDLENLSDDAVRDLLRGVRKEAIRQTRRPWLTQSSS